MSETIAMEGASVSVEDRTLVGPVSFVAEARSITCLVGPNGSGKTSLLRAIAGLCEYQGSIRIAGIEGRALELAQRSRLVGYVPQRSLLEAPLRVSSVVAQGRFALGESKQRAAIIEQALDKVGMRDFAERTFPTLSLGEQRRVLIARALASEAPCLLLDEPDAFLDVGERLRLFALLGRLRDEGHTLLVVVHALDQALRHASRCAVLDKGALVACDVPERALDAAVLAQVFGVRLAPGQGPLFTLIGEA